MIITFAGHSFISSHKKIKEAVKNKIRDLSSNKQVICYLGGYGDFDSICVQACSELKRENYRIEMTYITPYFDISNQNKIKELKQNKLCDSVIYPPKENTPKRFAISKRNEWMIKNADIVIAYVNRTYGGAYKMIQIANKNKKQ